MKKPWRFVVENDTKYFAFGMVYNNMIFDDSDFVSSRLLVEDYKTGFFFGNRKQDVLDQDMILFLESWNICWILLAFVLRQSKVKSSV